MERALVADLLRVGTRCAPDWGVTSVRGQPVTDAERENALNNLEKWGYVKVRHAWEIGPACVEGLAAAHRMIGIQGLLSDHHREGGSMTTYNNSTNFGHGNVVSGVMTGGTGNVQHVAQTIDSRTRIELLGKIGQIERELEVIKGADDLRAKVEEIKAETQRDDVSRQSVRQRVMDAALTAGATEGAQVVAHHFASMLDMLPI